MIKRTFQCRFKPMLLVLAALAQTAHATTCIDYSHRLNWISLTPTFSPIFEFARDGNFAYVATGLTGSDFLKIYDLSNLESPTLLSTSLFSDIDEISVQDGHMLLAEFPARLLSCDVSDAMDIKILDSLTIATAAVRDMVRRGDLVYLAVDKPGPPDGLWIVRISEQGGLSLEAFLHIPGFPHCVDVEGDVAFVGTLSGSLCAVDVSDLTNLRFLSCFDGFPSMDAFDLDVEGDFVYVADGHFGLRVFRADDPENLVPLNQIQLSGEPFEVKVDLGRLFIAPAGEGVQVYDLSQPDAPSLRGSIPGFSYPLAASDGKLFCQTFETLGITDASRLKFPEPLHQLDSIDLPLEIETLGRTAFALGLSTDQELSTLKTISFDDPQNPFVSSTIELEGVRGESMTWAAPYLYVGTRKFDSFGGSLLVFKYQDQPTPQYLSGLVLGGPVTDIAVDRDIAYALVTFFGVRVIDMSSPELPIVLGTWPSTPTVRSLEVLQDDIVLCSLDGVLSVMDVSVPTNPQVLLQIPELIAIGTIKLQERRALVASDSGVVTLVDFADPLNPVILGADQSYSNPNALAFDDEHAYVVHQGPLMTVFDLSDPEDLHSIGLMPRLFNSQDIEIADGFLVTASSTSGIYVLPLQCEEPLASDVQDIDRIVPDHLWSPNPFRGSTSLAIDVKEESTFVLEVFDVSGRRIVAKQPQVLNSGVHHIRWDGYDAANQDASPGVYWSRIHLNDQVLTAKLLKIR